jgi:hypothetical protein
MLLVLRPHLHCIVRLYSVIGTAESDSIASLALWSKTRWWHWHRGVGYFDLRHCDDIVTAKVRLFSIIGTAESEYAVSLALRKYDSVALLGMQSQNLQRHWHSGVYIVKAQERKSLEILNACFSFKAKVKPKPGRSKLPKAF